MSLFLLLVVSPLASAWISILLHEGAHAVVGRLAGLGIREIRVGIGPTVVRFRLLEADIHIGLVPVGGRVMTFPPLHYRKSAMALLYLAGPAMDLAWLAALLAMFRSHGGSQAVNILLLSAILVQAVIVWSSLVPRSVTLYGVRLPNDMLALWRTLRQGDDPNRAYRTAYLDALRRYGGPAEPTRPPSARSERIAYHLMKARTAPRPMTDEAIDAFERELSRACDRREQILIIETMVMSVLARPDSRHLAQLDRWTSRSLALAPHLPTLKGSRGAALARLGRHAEALDILAQAEVAEETDRCLNSAFQALAHFHGGRPELAATWMTTSLTVLRSHGWDGWIGRRIVERIRSEIGHRTGGEPQGRPEDGFPAPA